MGRARHRWLALPLLAALAAGGGALTAGRGPVAEAASSPGRPDLTQGAHGAVRSAAANQQAAETSAASLLASLNLPPGATRQASEPAGDDGTLGQPASGPPMTPNVVDDAAWWVVPGTVQQVVQYLEHHPPAGGQPSLSGQGSSSGKPTVTAVGFGWPAVPGQLSLRTLVVAVVQLQNGSTGVRADGEAVWITPRPASERLPGGAQRVVLSTSRFGKLVQGPFTVTSRREVRKIVSLLNALPAFQPGAFSCPADFGWRIRLAFYGSMKDSNATPIAVAVVEPNGCGAVRLRLRGRAQPALAGGYALTKRLSDVLHLKFDSGPPSSQLAH
jgi:hypothetical protein